MDRLFLIIAALSGAVSVGAGAFGAHALRARLEPRLLEVFQTGAQYQMYHALALLGVAWVASRWPGALSTASGWLFVAGTVLFSGSLYAMALTGVRALGAITPLGGVCFIAG
ncbi:MAG TPA: DUF423 domain-containing protein, partial [Gemmatimonadaceae bacterium]|nr:DUF423 domain-containing protein [Gemmatimonadaceae bacterium]